MRALITSAAFFGLVACGAPRHHLGDVPRAEPQTSGDASTGATTGSFASSGSTSDIERMSGDGDGSSSGGPPSDVECVDVGNMTYCGSLHSVGTSVVQIVAAADSATATCTRMRMVGEIGTAGGYQDIAVPKGWVVSELRLVADPGACLHCAHEDTDPGVPASTAMGSIKWRDGKLDIDVLAEFASADPALPAQVALVISGLEDRLCFGP